MIEWLEVIYHAVMVAALVWCVCSLVLLRRLRRATPRYRCTRCGWSEIEARRYRCSYGPCPMEPIEFGDRMRAKGFAEVPTKRAS